MTSGRVLVVGEVAVDVLVDGAPAELPGGQAEVLVSDARLAMGSSGAITAAALSALGVPVAYVGIAGDDPLGDFFVSELGGRGVDVSAVARAAGRRTGMTVALEAAGDRTMLTYPGTMAEMAADDVPDRLLTGTAHLHVSSWFLQQRLQAGMPGLIRRAHAAGLTVSVDPGWDVNATWTAGLAGILGELDWFLPNEGEAIEVARRLHSGAPVKVAREVAGRGDPGERRDGAPPVTDLWHALDVLARAARGVAVKRAGAGAAARMGSSEWRLDTEPLTAVDTTGAGDNFNAGWIAAIIDGLDPAAALAMAVACGRHAVMGRGGTGRMASRREAQAVAQRLAGEIRGTPTPVAGSAPAPMAAAAAGRFDDHTRGDST